jgi:hypothetical protein
VLSPGEDGEEAVRRYLTPEVREALVAFRFMSLVAEGDAFALQVNPFMGPTPGDEVGALRGWLRRRAGWRGRWRRRARACTAGPKLGSEVAKPGAKSRRRNWCLDFRLRWHCLIGPQTEER